MSEDVANKFAFPNFTTPVSGTLREFLDKETTAREKPPLNCLGMKKLESGCVSMMLKTGMEVAQDYNFLKYVPPRP